ncbi:MAG: DUF1488 family protein, partial [Armatimonadota bacterium]
QQGNRATGQQGNRATGQQGNRELVIQIEFRGGFIEEVDEVKFYADVNGERVRCRISVVALQDHFGQDDESAGACFLNNRDKIEDLARRKIEAGQLSAGGDVLITTMDFTTG